MSTCRSRRSPGAQKSPPWQCPRRLRRLRRLLRSACSVCQCGKTADPLVTMGLGWRDWPMRSSLIRLAWKSCTCREMSPWAHEDLGSRRPGQWAMGDGVVANAVRPVVDVQHFPVIGPCCAGNDGEQTCHRQPAEQSVQECGGRTRLQSDPHLHSKK